MDYAYYTDSASNLNSDNVEYKQQYPWDDGERVDLGGRLPPWNETLNETDATNSTGAEFVSPYHLWEMIMITAVTVPVIIGIIFGNSLVCIVIHKDRQLKTVQNWFIASLAIADLLVGLTIMPFTLANEVMGYWVFGSILCDLWLAADVLLCTSSILHLCLISLDRYWSITQAIKYVRKRTPKRAALMIATVWAASALVCLPPLIGWKGPRDLSQYPKCSISDDVGYVVYSCMGSFYVPLCVMIIVYFRIYLAARKRAHRNIPQQKANQHMEQRRTLFLLCSCHDSTRSNPSMGQELSCFSKNPSSDSNEKDHNSDSECSEFPSKDMSKPRAGETKCTEEIHDLLIDEYQNQAKITLDTNDSTEVQLNLDNGNHVIENVHKLDSEAFCSEDGHLCPPVKKSSVRKGDSKKATEKSPLNRTTSDLSRKTQRSEAEKQKRRIARAKERRATLVLGIIMAAFTVCWFPFFTMYMVATIWHLYISDPVFKFFFWLGYCNSAFNPIIYTIFNRDFKSAFYKLLCPGRHKH